MLSNTQSNLVCYADTLKSKHPEFEKLFREKLDQMEIDCMVLHGTKDIWCRDYMPVQVRQDKLVQFRYDPEYLRKEKHRPSITDTTKVCEKFDVEIISSDIILDGGNIVSCGKKVILTDQVCKDNKEIEKSALLDKLSSLLEADEIIIVPHQTDDIFGHADGMLRFINEDTVLVNDYSTKESKSYIDILHKTLKNHKLEAVPFSYSPVSEKNADGIESAAGIYINFLHVGDKILLPVFDCDSDITALYQLEGYYPTYSIETINALDIAKEGGVLNCITWDVENWKMVLDSFEVKNNSKSR